MRTFEFSLIASGLDPQDEDFESRFYEGGCDDATVSFQRGRIIVDFAREADLAENAITSAVVTVRGIGAKVERVEPDPLVSLSDIAARAQMTRAAISQYAKGLRGRHFPAPVARVTSESPLYDWSAVARWLCDHDRVAHDEVEFAEVIEEANIVLASDASDFARCLAKRLKVARGRLSTSQAYEQTAFASG